MASDMSVCGKVRRGYLRTMSTVNKNVFGGNVGKMVKENPKYTLDGNRIAHFPCFEWKEKSDEPVIYGNHEPNQHVTDGTDEPAKAETEMQDAPLISRYYLDLECPNRLKDELKQFEKYMKNYKIVPDLQKIRGMGFTVGVGSGTSELMIRFARLNRRMLILEPLPVYKHFTIQRPRAHLERIREGAISDFDHTHYPTYLIMRSKRNTELLQQCEPLIRRNGFQTSSKGEHAIKNLDSVFRAHDRLSEVTKYFSALKESVDSSLEREGFKDNVLHGNVIHARMCADPIGHASLDKA
ncbi:unnamed protein product [Owenia fusiformis]|uniref:Uncharacterized protein n=1 Tax=Owenia fusiformis TaxID=6347 RepID=A0A8J1TUP0_OWEFU|nr:unnamed protein product [Owenia fusiformis]